VQSGFGEVAEIGPRFDQVYSRVFLCAFCRTISRIAIPLGSALSNLLLAGQRQTAYIIDVVVSANEKVDTMFFVRTAFDGFKSLGKGNILS
jgi:hypothetical protein